MDSSGTMYNESDENAMNLSPEEYEESSNNKNWKVDTNVPVLRRSSRRRNFLAAKTADTFSLISKFPTPTSTIKKKLSVIGKESKKFKKAGDGPSAARKLFFEKPPAPTLLTLPYLALQNCMSHMDVETLEQLSKTCSYFDQLINGKYLTSLEVPFDAHFLKEVSSTNTIEKKPLLKLKCPKSRESFRHAYKDELPYGSVPPSDKLQLMSQMSVHHVLSEKI